MRILHLAAGNRWTGAAAPAFAEVEALREAGADAHYAYVGGYKLEAKIGALPFTHALIEKAQNPVAFARGVRALRRLGRFDFVHAHLTHDHWLGAFVARHTGARLARTFHARRVLRGDPLTRVLLNASRALFVINEDFRDAAIFDGRDVTFTPPPVDHRQFTPEGANVRALYGIAPHTRVLAVIGKLSPGRGFEKALEAFAHVRGQVSEAKLMIIGHGEHRPFLESLSHDLGVGHDVIWAGYHEADLAGHYRAADLLLFTARGSDEGHRAVLEAMACGVPPVVAPVEGVGALLRGFESDLIAAMPSSGALAQKALALLAAASRESLSVAVASHSRQFGYAAAARRLLDAYSRAAL